MALRLLELTIPNDELEALREMLEDQPVLHTWSSEGSDEIGIVRILLDSQNVEELSDALVDRFDSDDRMRIVLSAVEATVPRVDQTPEGEDEENADPEDDESAKQRVSREELYEDLFEASRLTPAYAIMVALSAVVAAVGMLRDDVAVVVGAMVIAPLLGPNVAVSLACALGDLNLARHSLRASGVGLVIAGAISVLLGWVLEVDPSIEQLASRTRASLGDIALALSAGAAGSLAFTSGVPAVLVGVMVAVALLPPLVAAGLMTGAGLGGPAMGALTLVFVNVICINLAAVATFFFQKVRPRTWREEATAKKATRIAVAIWVVLLLLLLLVILFTDVGAVNLDSKGS